MFIFPFISKPALVKHKLFTFKSQVASDKRYFLSKRLGSFLNPPILVESISYDVLKLQNTEEGHHFKSLLNTCTH